MAISIEKSTPEIFTLTISYGPYDYTGKSVQEDIRLTGQLKNLDRLTVLVLTSQDNFIFKLLLLDGFTCSMPVGLA